MHARTPRFSMADAPAARRDGIILSWLQSLDAAARDDLFRRVVRTDVALALALPSTYASLDRVARASLLLVAECASAMHLDTGELALLSPGAETDLLHALAYLTELHPDPPRPRRRPRTMPRTNRASIGR